MLLLLFSGGPFSGTPSTARTYTVPATSRTLQRPGHIKDPDAVEDFSVNWATWLSDDAISTSEWEVPDGLTSTYETNSTTRGTIWVSGGAVRRKYSLINRIVTAGGRTNDQTVVVKVRDK